MNAKTHAALVDFFSRPKARYTHEDLEPLFANDVIRLILDGASTASRSSVANHIAGFIPASAVSAAVAEVAPDSPLVVTPATYNLPRWVVAKLEEWAEAAEKTSSDYLSEMLIELADMETPDYGEAK